MNSKPVHQNTVSALKNKTSEEIEEALSILEEEGMPLNPDSNFYYY